MAARVGSFRHSLLQKSKEKLLSRKGYSELGLGSSDGDEDDRVKCECFHSLSDKIIKFSIDFRDTATKFYEMGRSDPRKVYFAAKMGLALAIVSLLIFFKEPLKTASQYSIWAILTVVVVFEFSVGIIKAILSYDFCPFKIIVNVLIFSLKFLFNLSLLCRSNT